MPTESCITYSEMYVFACTRLTIMTGPLMPCSETICMAVFNDVHADLSFFIQSLQRSDAFHKPLFFLHYLMLLHDGDQLQK